MFFNNQFINGLLASGKASAGVFNVCAGLAVLEVPEGKAIIITGYKFHPFSDLPEGVNFLDFEDAVRYNWHQMRFIGSKGINVYHFRNDINAVVSNNDGLWYYIPVGITQADTFFTSDQPVIIEITGNGSRVSNYVTTPNQMPNEVPLAYEPPPFGYGKKGPSSLNQTEFLSIAGPGTWEYRPYNIYTTASRPFSHTSFQWIIDNNTALNPPNFGIPFGNLTAPLVEINFIVVNKDVTAQFPNNITG